METNQADLNIKLIKAEKNFYDLIVKSRNKIQRLNALKDMTANIHSQHDIHELFNKIIENSLQMGIEKSVLLIKKKSQLIISDCAGYSRKTKEELIGSTVTVHKKDLALINSQKRYGFLGEVEGSLIPKTGLYRFIMAPIVFSDHRIFGYFIAGFSEEKFRFFAKLEEDDFVLFALLISQINLALQNITYSNTLRKWNKQLEKQKKKLMYMNEEISKANQLKSKFLSNISHDLRTPLHVIIGTNDFLLKNKKIYENSYLLMQVQMIQESSERLLNLVNDILDLSKLESGKITITKESIKVKELFECFPLMMETLLKGKPVIFSLNLKVDLEMTMETDKQKMCQILMNLLSNAAKFTQAGSIQLSAENKQDRLYFTIKDTGIGIKQQELDKIFEAFYQIDNSLSKKYKGTGLGLGICKQFIGLLGGDISVESNIEKGTTFTFWVPLVKAKEAKPKQMVGFTYQKESYDFLKEKYILICDDDEFNRQFADLILKDYIQYDLVKSGYEAISQAKHKKYDLIFLDIQMPEMDGKEALKKLKEKSELNSKTPVVALTAQSMKGDREELLGAGFNEYLSKPFSQEDILKLIHRMLSHAKTKQPSSRALVKQSK